MGIRPQDREDKYWIPSDDELNDGSLDNFSEPVNMDDEGVDYGQYGTLSNNDIDVIRNWLNKSNDYHTNRIVSMLTSNLSMEDKLNNLNGIDDVLQNILLSIGSAMLAQGISQEVSNIDKRNNLVDDLGDGSYTKLPNDYYTARETWDYVDNSEYDDNGNLVKYNYGSWEKTDPAKFGELIVSGDVYDLRGYTAINNLVDSVGFSGVARDSFRNAVFYATMYGIKQFIYQGKGYLLPDKLDTGDSVGNSGIGVNNTYWFYSKNLGLVGIGGWMKSKFGNYAIKKRV